MTVKCRVCGEPGIENVANNKTFWFCQKCRIEITPESVPFYMDGTTHEGGYIPNEKLFDEYSWIYD